MRKQLQDISFRVSRYFRPLEPWHCGGLENGEQCPLGPDRKGRCRAQLALQDDQGQASRACRPVANLRARRQRVGWIAMIAVLAVLTLGFSYDSWKPLAMPGPLSVHHMSFGGEDCDSCHQAAVQPKSSWVSSLLGTHPSVDDAKNCIACHQIGEVPENPHSLPSDQLLSLTEAMNAHTAQLDTGNRVLSASLLVNVAQQFVGEEAKTPSCTVCHNEHTGSDQITQVSNQQCAVCHTASFADISAHNDFTDYPANRRTQIVFNHNSHLNKHFLDEDSSDLAPQNCIDCHRADSMGKKMEVRGFDTACSSCHLEQITGENRTSAKGIAMLAFPAVDTETLLERGVDVGSWPADSDAELTPLNLLMIGLLNPELSPQLTQLRALDLYDLRDASDAELDLVYHAMWTLKQSYFEMQRGGAQSMLASLQKQLVTDSGRAREVLGLLSPDLIDAAVSQAFPNLAEEMQQWLIKGLPALRLVAKTENEAQEATAINKVTEGENNEDWLAAAAGADEDDWLEDAADDTGDEDWLSEAAEDDSDDWLDEAVADSQDADDDDWLNEAAQEESSDDWLDEAVVDSEDTTDDDAWLNEATQDESDDWLDEAVAESAEPDEGDDWLNEAAGDDADSLDDDWLEDSLDDDNASLFDDENDIAVEAIDESKSVVTVPELLAIEDRAAAGGWYFEDFYLRYRPSGHADRLIVAWVELLINNTDSAMQSAMMSNVLSKDSPGTCIKCHSVDRQQIAGITRQTVNWLGKKASLTKHGFNSFAHQSHIAVIKHANSDLGVDEVDGCQACHKPNRDSDSSLAYEQEILADFQSDFYNLDKQQCIECHQPETQLANCTQCHNYHIGERVLVGMKIGFQSEAGKVKQTFSTQLE
ncbi:MAG: hypothetical protein AAF431_02600 [Pseudomonadota bacterium]